VVGEISKSGSLPKEDWDDMVSDNPSLSYLNKRLKTALEYNPKKEE